MGGGLCRNQEDLACQKKAFFGWIFILVLSYAMEFIMSFLMKLMKIQKHLPTKVCLSMG